MSARNMAKRTAAGTLALAVCLGGGALALAGAAQADANFKFDTRIAGDDRYATAIAASKAAFPTDGSAQNVVLVNGFATVDGLTASYLAGVANAPILYVSDQGADAATKAEIKRLGAKNVWLVGGEKVIPTSVEAAIKGDGYSVSRINGSDRYETAAMVAEAGIKMSGKKPSKVFVASGASFADALAVSPVAFAKGYPIILTEKDSTSDFSTKELGNIGTDNKILVGGEAVVSKAVAAKLSINESARVAGADRAVTANLVSDWAKKSEGFNPANAALVGGTNGNGADSLVAASLGGKSLTTLHFAGWDATNVYLKDHSAELTGKGFVFGGKAAVPGDQVDKAQAAAQSVAAAAGQIVTAVSNGSFSVADSASMAAKKYTLKSSDKYVVGGSAATQGAFAASLAVGATVSVTVSGDVSTYTLTPLATTGFSSGIVGALNTTGGTVSGQPATSFSVIEPITGTKLPFLSATAVNYTYTTGGSFVNYTVDGQSVSQGIFEGALSLGDSVSVKGTGADLNNIRTVALVSGSLTGTITAPTYSATSGQEGTLTGFSIKTSAGAVLGPIAVSGFSSGDTFSVDGTSATQVSFVGSGAVGSATASPVSTGDQVTFAKAGGVQKFTLVNAAPNKLAGSVVNTITISGTTTATDANGVAYWSPAGSITKTLYSAVSRYVIDGTIASKADFVAAVSAGDAVVYQAADTTTNTASSLTLTSKPVSGTVTNAVSGGTHTLDVLNADGDQIATGLDYTSTASYFAATGTPVYTVDGSTATYAQFDAAVSRIQSGARQGSIQVSASNAVVTYALSTTAFTSAPSVVKATSAAANAASQTVVITFSKPITMGTANSGAAVPADWSVSINGSAYSLAGATASWNGSKTVLTFTGATATTTSTAGQSLVVSTTSATAGANYLDTYGTGLGTASYTGVIG